MAETSTSAGMTEKPGGKKKVRREGKSIYCSLMIEEE